MTCSGAAVHLNKNKQESMINERPRTETDQAADLYFYLRAFITATNWGCSHDMNVQTATTFLNVSLLFLDLICLRGEYVFV